MSRRSAPDGSRMSAWWRAERGFASLAITILSMPLILAAFGYGFDSMRLSYFHSFLTSRAEAAAAAGASTTYTKKFSSGKDATVVIGEFGDDEGGNAAMDVAYNNYLDNTASKRGTKPLSCDKLALKKRLPDRDPTPGELDSQMKRLLGSPGYRDTCTFASQVVGDPVSGVKLCSPSTESNPGYGLVVGANERVTMTFLQIVGVDEQWLNNIRGVALIRAADVC